MITKYGFLTGKGTIINKRVLTNDKFSEEYKAVTIRKKGLKMTVKQLADRLQESSKQRNHEQRVSLLKKAHVLDDNGNYCKDFFSQETIQKDQNKRK